VFGATGDREFIGLNNKDFVAQALKMRKDKI